MIHEHPYAIEPREADPLVLASLVGKLRVTEIDWRQLDRPDGSEPPVGAFGVIATKGSWVSKAIAWSTCSFYNHAFLYVGGGTIIEGWWPVVRKVPVTVWSSAPTPTSVPRRILWSDYDGNLLLTATQADTVFTLANADVGKRYNLIQYLDFAGAFFGRDFKVSDRSGLKVCSTLVAFTWERAHTGLVLLVDNEERTQLLRKPHQPFIRWNEVSPAMLARALGEKRLWLPER